MTSGGRYYDGVVFDLFGTLTIDQTPADRLPLQLPVAQALGLSVEAFQRQLRDSFTPRATGVWGTARQALAELTRGADGVPTDEALDRALALRRTAEIQLARPRPGALELLADLRERGVPVGVLTDCTHELVLVWPELPYGSLVDAVVTSYEMGVRKPDARMYAEIATRLGASATRLVYVGDGGSNELTGALAAGMRPVMLRSAAADGADVAALRYDGEPGWSGERVVDVRGLRRLFSTVALLP